MRAACVIDALDVAVKRAHPTEVNRASPVAWLLGAGDLFFLTIYRLAPEASSTLAVQRNRQVSSRL